MDKLILYQPIFFHTSSFIITIAVITVITPLHSGELDAELWVRAEGGPEHLNQACRAFHSNPSIPFKPPDVFQFAGVAFAGSRSPREAKCTR